MFLVPKSPVVTRTTVSPGPRCAWAPDAELYRSADAREEYLLVPDLETLTYSPTVRFMMTKYSMTVSPLQCWRDVSAPHICRTPSPTLRPGAATAPGLKS